jgi:hypothetical protein
MALLTCVECGRSVSDQALTCPGCGLPAARPAVPATSWRATPPPPPKKAASPQRTVIGAAALVGGVILVAALVVRSEQRERGVREAEAAQIAEAQAKNAAALREKAAQEARSKQQQAAAESNARAQSAAMDRGRRDAALRACAVNPECPKWQRDALVEGAPLGPERDHAIVLLAALEARAIARNGKDGTTLSTVPAGLIAGLVARDSVGLAAFDQLPKTTLADAKKDPDGARGGVLRVSGTVIEIHKTDEVYDGALMTGNGDVVRFVTMMPTTGVYAQSWASFSGVFVQQFDYPNVSGGQTRSLLLVGAFDIPENRKR